MNRSVATSLLILTLCAAPALAQNLESLVPASRPTVTVASFETDRTGWMPPPHLGDTLAELLTDRLVSAGAFRMVDRQWLVSASSSDGIGRVPFAAMLDRASTAGVEYLIAGSVTRLSIEKKSSTTGGVVPIPVIGGLFRKSKTESVIGLVIRVINVRTGEVLATSTAQSGASLESKSGGGILVIAHVPLVAGHGTSRDGYQDRLLDQSMQQAITAAADKLVAAAPRMTRQ